MPTLLNRPTSHRRSDQPLTDVQRAVLGAMLDEQWQFRTEQVAYLTEPGRRETETERQINQRILTAAWTVLAEIQAARARIADGSYGRCVSCKTALPVERLKAVPQVAMCDRCQFAAAA